MPFQKLVLRVVAWGTSENVIYIMTKWCGVCYTEKRWLRIRCWYGMGPKVMLTSSVIVKTMLRFEDGDRRGRSSAHKHPVIQAFATARGILTEFFAIVIEVWPIDITKRILPRCTWLLKSSFPLFHHYVEGLVAEAVINGTIANG